MNCPGAAARRSSIAGAPCSTNSVCSIMTTASAPRGMMPPVATAVAVAPPTSSVGAWPQAITSALSVSTLGRLSLAPSVSSARTAKPSTLERSNGGASASATTSCASTRPSASASATLSAASGARSMRRAKRARASSGDTTSRNCSCRAAARTRARSSVSARDRDDVAWLMATAIPERRSRRNSPRFRPGPARSRRPSPAPTAADSGSPAARRRGRRGQPARIR